MVPTSDHSYIRPRQGDELKVKESRGMRLNRFLAAAGLGSRRSCEEHILKGRVSINGSVVRDLATSVHEEDDVRISGRVIHAIAPRTILLNKPAGYTTTRSDKFAERTIFELIPTDAAHLFHVGRLDMESEGLLLLTNDGVLAQDLMHPSKGVDKEYEVILDRTFTERDAALLKKGTWIEGSMARVEAVRTLAPNKIQIILHQGLKRQIRIMLSQLGFKVQRLIRTRLGPLTLRGVKPGSYRDLKEEDLAILRKALAAPRPKKAKSNTKASAKSATPAIRAQKLAKPRSSKVTAPAAPAVADAEGWATPSGKPRKVSPTHARTRKAS